MHLSTYFTQEIAGDEFELIFPIPADIDPAFFEPGAALDTQMEKAFSSWADAFVSASHPVYQYLGERYGLHIHSEHWEPGNSLKKRVLKL